MAKLLGILILVLVAAAVLTQVIMPGKKASPNPAPAYPTPTPIPSQIPTQQPTTKPIQPSATPTTANLSKVLIQNVPFTPQAPFAEWSDARFQEGCEEASVLMTIYWVRSLPVDRIKAREEIIAMAAYQVEHWGEARDTSTQDTATRLVAGYFNYQNYEIKENINLNDIKNEILKGNLVIVPANGRALNNPHFTAPGPDRHMIVVRGYDDNTKNFITNDPGIREGELYIYPQQLFFDAIRDYPTGYNLPIVGDKKIMIVIKKS